MEVERMSCEWGHTDCEGEGTKCELCFSDSFHYKPAKARKKPQLAHRQPKADGRMGSSFEFKNHQANEALITGASTRMTPNSGAGHIKGDQEINGIITVMEELKTKVKKQAPGRKTFTIEKEWLDKLNREARAVNKSFWYLKFSFHENDEDVYVICEQDIIMSFVATIIEERKTAIKAKADIDVAEKRARLVEAENVVLKAEIELLKAELTRLKLEE
jgi:hypothetical protein